MRVVRCLLSQKFFATLIKDLSVEVDKPYLKSSRSWTIDLILHDVIIASFL
jgi:hypothetical protein